MTTKTLRTRTTPQLYADLTGLTLAEATADIEAAHHDLFALPKRPVLAVAAFQELLHRAVTVPPNRKIIANPANIVKATLPYRSKADEHLIVVSINNGRPEPGIKAINVAAIGTPAGCDFTDHTVLRWPILHAVTDFVIVHNHPNDDPTPSAQDIAYTNALARSAAILHLRLLDHIIIANTGYISMREKGLL